MMNKKPPSEPDIGTSNTIPFGLSIVPASFRGFVNGILAEKLDFFVIVCLDDILIYTKDPGQGPIEAIQWVLVKEKRAFCQTQEVLFS